MIDTRPAKHNPAVWRPTWRIDMLQWNARFATLVVTISLLAAALGWGGESGGIIHLGW
jgi:hypothetical protein